MSMPHCTPSPEERPFIKETNINLSEVHFDRTTSPARIGEVQLLNRAPHDELGATFDPALNAVHFTIPVDPKQVHEMSLVLFQPGEKTPCLELPMSQKGGQFYLSITGEGIEPGLRYGFVPKSDRFDESRYEWVVDPYAKALTTPEWKHPKEYRTVATKYDFEPPIAVVAPSSELSLRPSKVSIPHGERVIYELLVQSFRDFPDQLVPEEFKGTQGTYKFFQSPTVIDYLKGLGVTSVELMPPHAIINDWELFSRGAENQWGYMPLNFFAINGSQCYATDPVAQLDEFKRTVDVLHENGFEVIIDFVGGHSAEGGPRGPTMSMRAFAEKEYYIVDQHGNYLDMTGCGNTININSKLGRELILKARDYWLDELGVDGIRVDQAFIFGLDPHNPESYRLDHPFLTEFASREDATIIGEPGWGKGATPISDILQPGWYQHIFVERELVPMFFSGFSSFDYSVRGMLSIREHLSDALAGYGTLFGHENRSVRFADCHDGHTTWDRTAMAVDHLRWHAHMHIPYEGEKEIRVALARAIHGSVVLSPGAVMINRGAELLHTQDGNSNPYDRADLNTLKWNFSEDPMGQDRLKFLSYMQDAVALRKELRVFDTTNVEWKNYVQWYERSGTIIERGTGKNDHELQNRWKNDFGKHYLGAFYTERPRGDGEEQKKIFVARAGVPLEFHLPDAGKMHVWQRRLDSSLPDDNFHKEILSGKERYRMDLPGIAVFEMVRKDKLS